MSNYKSYFLEKTFELENGKLVDDKSALPIVRPCALSYQYCLEVLKENTKQWLQLEGCIAHFDPTKWSSFEEWIVDLNVNHGIVADFEEHMLIDRIDGFKTYVMKAIDLHTHKTIYDATDKIIEIVSKKN